jgi:hypothetical protein
MAMLRWARKGNIRATSAPRLVNVTTIPCAVRWYVALVTSPLGLICVTTSILRTVFEFTDALGGPGEVRWT